MKTNRLKSTRRKFIQNLGLSITALAAGNSQAAALATPRRKPNFLFILADDLGWTDLGCYGSSFYETPNLDRLAAEGVKFTNGYAACPVCSPTRASIMTGKSPARIGLTNWLSGNIKKKLISPPYIKQLPLEEVTLAEALKEAGYSTFFAGKWHLGAEAFWPENQGFDLNKGGCDRGGPYGGKKYFSPYDNPRLEDGPDGEHLPDRLASETVKFIREKRDTPFLAYLSFYSVHTPLMARQDLKKKYEKKRADAGLENVWRAEGRSKSLIVQNHAVYAGMVEAMDQAVGKVLDEIKRLNLQGDTVVFFTSDNGGMSTQNGPTSNRPLRTGKGWIYEGGIREPYIIKWPGVSRPGSTCDQPATSMDFYPTMLEMAELPPRPTQHIDGVSLAPLLKGKKSLNRPALYWHYPHYSPQGGDPGGAVRAGDYKLLEFFEDNHTELYNLKDDIGEEKDLSKTNPEKTRELLAMLRAWQKEVGAKFPTPNPAYKAKK